MKYISMPTVVLVVVVFSLALVTLFLLNLLNENTSFVPLPFAVWDFFYSFGNPPLRKSVVGCGAVLSGDKLIETLLVCVARHYRHYNPDEPIYELGSVSVQWMIKRRRQHPLFYVSKHYSDLLSYHPVLGAYKAVVVTRHPLDRILAAFNHYKTSTIEPWLFDKNIYKPSLISKDGDFNMSFKEYINSLSNTDGLLYSIYIASLYFQDEISELGRIRALKVEGLEFFKLEDFNNNSEATLARLAGVLQLESDIIMTTCAPPPLLNSMGKRDDRKGLANSRGNYYIYSGDFECIHYLYFERIIGIEALIGFGYSDDIRDYNTNKALACSKASTMKSTIGYLRAILWPPFDSLIFNASFGGYEFKLNRIARLSAVKGEEARKVVNSLIRLDELKVANRDASMVEASSSFVSKINNIDLKPNFTSHINGTITTGSNRGGIVSSSSSSSSVILETGFKTATIDPIEVEQILDVSRNNDKNCVDNIDKASIDQALTNRYLSYMKQTNEYKSLNRSEKANLLRSTDKSFPIASAGSWIHQFCPEVVKFMKDNEVRYFDFYSTDDEVPLTTTEAAITMTCMIKAIGTTADEVGVNWALFAGTQLGAVLHGGPIPWDDDLDILVDGKYADVFMGKLQEKSFGGRQFRCDVEQIFHKVRRCYIDDQAYMSYRYFGLKKQFWPFVDIFFFYSGDELTLEYSRLDKSDRSDIRRSDVSNDHRRLHTKVWRNEDFYPFRRSFYGGVTVPTLRHEAAMLHYDVDKCYSGYYNHRVDKAFGNESRQLNCCKLSRYLPFIRRRRSLFDKRVSLEIMMIGDRPIHLNRVDAVTEQEIDSFHLRLGITGEGDRKRIKMKGNHSHGNNGDDYYLTYVKHSNY